MIILRYIWRLWFYILALVTIIVLLPILVLTILSDKTYKQFFFIARLWAHIVFYGMGMRLTLEKEYVPIKNKSYIIVANHTSMLDIMLMLILVKDNPFVFVGKAELAKLPIFGYIYRRTCILVDRNNVKSRGKVYDSARKKINQGLSICIFPEGGVSDNFNVLLDPFKEGAFKLALEHKLPILPLTFYGLKYYFPFISSIGKPGRVFVKIHKPIEVEQLNMKDKQMLKDKTYSLLFKQLMVYKSKNPL